MRDARTSGACVYVLGMLYGLPQPVACEPQVNLAPDWTCRACGAPAMRKTGGASTEIAVSLE